MKPHDNSIMSSFLLPTAEIEFKLNSTASDYDNSEHDDFRNSGNYKETAPARGSAIVSKPGDSRPTKAKKLRPTTCEVAKLTAYDSKMVRRWRLITIFMTLALGLIVSLAGFFVLKRSQDCYTKQSFIAVTERISELASRKSFRLTREALNLARVVAATANISHQTFPFVTVPSWDMRGEHALDISGADFAFWMPLVETSKVSQWISYSNSTSQSPHTTGGSDKHGSMAHNVPYAYDATEDGSPKPASTSPFLAPIWQGYPADFLDGSYVNLNMFSVAGFSYVVDATSPRSEPFFSTSRDATAFAGSIVSLSASNNVTQNFNSNPALLQPRSFLVQPIFSTSMVGMITLLVPWERYLNEVLPPNVTGIYCILENSCGESFTYWLNENNLEYLGEGDFHDKLFESTGTVIPIEPEVTSLNETNAQLAVKGNCNYYITIYASSTYDSHSPSGVPIVFATVAASVTVLGALAFLQYDRLARRRNEVIENIAKQSTALLATLFPTNVAKRLFAEEKHRSLLSNKGRLKCFLDETTEDNTRKNRKAKKQEAVINRFVGKPIADIFPETTVLFADIAGFTAWSSHRQPEQVFRLLETIYRAFDIIARGNKVYKVETIGDCYVAVTGLPDPRRDHAVAMAQFAREIIAKMRVLVTKLVPILGRDTSALELRVGIHSGPVTGGVLRGDRSRFQLFGDTMNTASRMESTSQAGKVQLSQETTDLLIAAGKFHWIELRESTVVAKGKGEMQTYWLTVTDTGDSVSDDLDFQALDAAVNMSFEEQRASTASAEKIDRLIGWNTECLVKVLREIVALRESSDLPPSRITSSERHFTRFGETVLDEVCEKVDFPTLQPSTKVQHVTYEDVELNDIVVDQMYDFVANIAGMYNNLNPFHNFEHASHVVMSVIKFLSVAKAQPARADVPRAHQNGGQMHTNSHALHDHTFGIASDPLSHFACIFGALIHGVDHAGVSNSQLLKEGAPIAEFYKGRSIQEQNALDLSWQMLMDDSYIELRQVIYTSDDELRRFRQLVVNSVVATDLVDEKLMGARNLRWARAFSDNSMGRETAGEDNRNRRATTVLEHMVQAADVAHTMQPWDIYLTWNQNLFLEHCRAHQQDRAGGNPVETWYHRQLSFFDFVVIPLAKKVRDCGVFGASSEECLSFALQNRAAWEERGQEFVSRMSDVARQALENEE